VFTEVPHVKAQAADRPGGEPKLHVERRTVMALAYPCEMYERGVLSMVQTVAVVREARKVGLPDDWSGGFAACPLPSLFADGVLWAADFRALCGVDRSFLAHTNRIATLSEIGWAYLRQRLSLYFARVTQHLDDLQQAGRATWDETEMWEQWNTLGRDPAGYQAWLDTPDPNIGFSRRRALDRGMRHLVASTLMVEG